MENENEASVSEMYVILDDVDAERTMRKLANIRRESNEYIGQYQMRIEQIKRRLETEQAFYTMALKDYFGRVEHRKTKTTESYQLANGKIEQKRVQPKYERDEEALVTWLGQHGMQDYVKVTAEADWKAIKGLTSIVGDNVVIKDTGEIIEGIKAVEQPDKFVVTTSGESQEE